jgi:hypothetical protein
MTDTMTLQNTDLSFWDTLYMSQRDCTNIFQWREGEDF